jgi:hypothetical protein
MINSLAISICTNDQGLETGGLPDVRQALGDVLFQPTPNFLKILNFHNYLVPPACLRKAAFIQCDISESLFYLFTQFSNWTPEILSNSFRFSVSMIRPFSTAVHPIKRSKSLIISPIDLNRAFSFP